MNNTIKLIFFLSFLVNSCKAQKLSFKEIDSCKVFVINYSAAYRTRIYPENLIHDFCDTSFRLNQNVYSKLMPFLDSLKNYHSANKPNSNKYSLDYRLLFLIYRNSSYDIIGFGANGLIAYNDSVYYYKKNILYDVVKIVPGIKEYLRL